MRIHRAVNLLCEFVRDEADQTGCNHQGGNDHDSVPLSSRHRQGRGPVGSRMIQGIVVGRAAKKHPASARSLAVRPSALEDLQCAAEYDMAGAPPERICHEFDASVMSRALQHAAGNDQASIGETALDTLAPAPGFLFQAAESRRVGAM